MKRGQLSIETIIIVILALLVLVIVAASFTGGMKALWEQIVGSGTLSSSAAVDRCNKLCTDAGADTQLLKTTFCTTNVVIKDVGTKSCKELNPSCAASC